MSDGWPPRFLFTAGRLCIDFAQTGGFGELARWERWPAPADLADWFAASELRLRVARVRPEELHRARLLRDAIQRAATSTLAGDRLDRAVAERLERHAAVASLVPVLNGGSAAWSPASSPLQALSTVARDAIGLFGTDARERLRRCKNPRCPLLFVDGSRAGRRAWCTMRRCGNLQKTARYRHKLREARANP